MISPGCATQLVLEFVVHHLCCTRKKNVPRSLSHPPLSLAFWHCEGEYMRAQCTYTLQHICETGSYIVYIQLMDTVRSVIQVTSKRGHKSCSEKRAPVAVKGTLRQTQHLACTTQRHTLTLRVAFRIQWESHPRSYCSRAARLHFKYAQLDSVCVNSHYNVKTR